MEQSCVPMDKNRIEGDAEGPPLANVLLDEVDRELERRGHSFAAHSAASNCRF